MIPRTSAVLLLVAFPCAATCQIAVSGGVLVAQAEHRVDADATLATASGTLFGGALGATIGRRFTIQVQAFGGQLTADGGVDNYDVAEAQLFGDMLVRPWLILQTGPSVRNFSNPLARQHWVTWRVGAEARVPLGFEAVSATLRGYWIPVVSVSGLNRPDVALAAGAGIDWRGRRIGVSALYSFERYDFPVRNGSGRLEDFATIRLRVALFWHSPQPVLLPPKS